MDYFSVISGFGDGLAKLLWISATTKAIAVNPAESPIFDEKLAP